MRCICRTSTGWGCNKPARGCKCGAGQREMCFVEPVPAGGAKNQQGDANVGQADMRCVCRTSTSWGCKKPARGCKCGAGQHEMCFVEPVLAGAAKNQQGDANVGQADIRCVCRTCTCWGYKELASRCKCGAGQHKMCL